MILKYFVVGGAGFIGSHLVRKLLSREVQANITIFDNFSSGRKWHLEEIKDNKQLHIIEGDAKDLEALKNSISGSDVVYHFASNPDISKAITQPDIDFWEGTYLTNNILEAMRCRGVKKIIYASGSGVYGDVGLQEIKEDHSPMLPISTYGASKLACESLISAYCALFGITASVFRFANVVGPRQTHGVCYDFIRKLTNNPSELTILGDGRQSKSYIYVSDVVNAVRLSEKYSPFGYSYFNVATQDYLEVKEIADMVVQILGLKDVRYIFTGGDRGWIGDVPVIRLNTDKITQMGWRNRFSSREAIAMSIESIHADFKANRLTWN